MKSGGVFLANGRPYCADCTRDGREACHGPVVNGSGCLCGCHVDAPGPVETTLDECPGGVLLQFFEGDADFPFARVALRDEDARALIETLTRTFEVSPVAR